ncbi:tetratricopeptide repeat protein [Flavobacterium sp. 14A]|uniref:tetratricopeptide repeat protein n=1 Tax=Flavobacterium sp. 14A TaxID=2735896 RepID=UPI00157139BE|nr:tetratricopeptide repeat protein [Flavobacterium sp. 14A]NRT12998.1 tetratricopeptide (TPR) repeat protein [Flavobacterium sp. 14A]
MKKLFLLFTLFISAVGFSQNEQLAGYYYERSDFEKAKLSYEELLQTAPQNMQYFLRIVDCCQQLKQYDDANKLLKERFAKYNQGALLVELGYNAHLQQDEVQAKSFYDQAIERVNKSTREVYSVANSFEQKSLLEYAVKAYDTVTFVQPNYKFDYQKALLYGQMGNMELMINTLLDANFENPDNSNLIKSQLARYLFDESDTSFSDNLRKALILRVQKTQDVFWNQYLSWFYVQQREYGKAFIQEKAIYKRNPQSLGTIVSLAQQSILEEDLDTAVEILSYITENTTDLALLIQADTYLIKMKIDVAKQNDYPAIDLDLEALLAKYEITPFTLSLQLIQAHFVAFNLANPEKARAIIDTALKLQLNNYQIAQAKMELADIMLYDEKFNQALLYYSQVELDLKNDVVAHEASLKAAKTSYFKADFKWALKQFKELKAANTQLIANDALEYYLLINDNTVADSTQTALKEFAKGDYLQYQNRSEAAIAQFQSILKQFKGQEIEAISLLRLGTIFEKNKQYDLALSQYQNIISNHADGIYSDEALYFSAEIYNKKLNEPEKAKPLYEKIIFNHEDSIYFVEARKAFRKLRGDTNL